MRVRELLGTVPPRPSDHSAERADHAAGMSPESGSWVPGVDTARAGPRAHSAGGTRSRLRFDPGRRGVAALGVAVVAAVAATGWWVAADRPSQVPVSATASGGGSIAGGPTGVSTGVSASVSGAMSAAGPAASAAGAVSPAAPASAVTTSAASSVVVDVAGKVRRPGVYELPAGSRVDDAVRAAGGASRGASTLSLNLAEVLRDGEQVVVGVPGASPAAPAAAAGAPATSGGAPGGTVDVNTATLEQLETLPGIGPVLAQNILDWRVGHGKFSAIDQLQDVSGIGPAKFAEIKGLVTL